MTTKSRRRSFGVTDALGYACAAGAVWLAWEVVKVPVIDRAAPAVSIRLASASPEVLRRAAEAELLAGRHDNAEALAAESLRRAPFNARALRVRGLAEAQLGSMDRADDMLTLAGNWSLRDDPAHAWLIENRLRRGDYRSAFAHADTLARRRADLYPSLFRLFSEAPQQDARALPVLVQLLAVDPPWRAAFLDYLHESDDGAPLLGGLAVALESTARPFTVQELEQLYTRWLRERRFAGIMELRTRLRRPPQNALIQDRGFSAESASIYPFAWTLGGAPGIAAGVEVDDLRSGNSAYRLEYDGFSSGVLLAQLLLLRPGTYTFEGEQRLEVATDDPRLQWSVACAETENEIWTLRPSTAAGDTNWRGFSASFVVPAENCSAQWLRLMPRPGDTRTAIVWWLDNLGIRSSSKP